MRKIKILALVLALVLVLASCSPIGKLFDFDFDLDFDLPFGDAQTNGTSDTTETTSEETTESQSIDTSSTESSETTETTESQTEYRDSISRSRAEIEAMLTITDDDFTAASELLAAFEAIGLESNDIDTVDAAYLEFEDKFYFVSTQVSISSIIYYIDMSNEAAYEKYNTLYEKYGDLYDAYVESCKKLYNDSPVSAELFADWTEEEIQQMLGYSPEITELQLKNDELTNELNNLSDAEFYDRSAEIYAEIVTNNNRIAELMGYDNYYDYATKEIYLRDYTRADLEAYCNNVAANYIPKYEMLVNNYISAMQILSYADYNNLVSFVESPFDKIGTNYVEGYISTLDGSMKEGMEHVFVNKNMVFSNMSNSHPTAFQTYLDYYDMPFCLFGSSGQSSTTLIHEFGHYYASLYNSSLTSYDLAETQSQGNEMLFMCYLSNEMPTPLFNGLRCFTMYSNMTTIISCVLIDEFEREVYALESVEGYTSADFDAIMDRVCEKYGGKAFIEENLGDMNGYWRQVATNNPVYYISYAISLTAALNIYAEANKDITAGREIYRKLIEDVTEDMGFLAALEMAGLPSPFSDESNQNVTSVIWSRK